MTRSWSQQEALIHEIPTHSLWDAMGDAGWQFEEAFLDYWGLEGREPTADPELTEDQHRELISLWQLAEKLAHGAESLVRPARLKDKKLSLHEWLAEEAASKQRSVDELLEEAKAELPENVWWQVYRILQPSEADDPRVRRRFLETCMQIQAHKRFSINVNRMADRMLALLGVMIRQPGEFTRAYLSRVALCYIHGMPTELAVMARAVLDQAIQEVIKDHEVKDEVGVAPGKWVGLQRRIEACYSDRIRLFDKAEYEAATYIRERGDHAAHFSPGFEGDPDQLLANLASVLRALEKAKS